ncbi:two-component system sensor histidine kinase CreC [Motiliproteus sp. MSK22-1]|uniref:two-component system sensor histidine kinase CreC n=1 Tax=Motiliproteus sp. MSK22-1 TaxID=1897630 RepID=UPI0013015215|nr:two-component system sensor histidine kinase CreC [Motiliproteus sp. MSK22-1]
MSSKISFPKIRFSLRLFFFFFLLIGIGLFLQMNTLIKELKPGLRQAAEDTLVDSANLLAELATPDFIQGTLSQGHFDQAFKTFKQRKFRAKIWTKTKTDNPLRVYITNAQGIVVYHSEGQYTGEDFSAWNDVYKTLRGQYGARSSLRDPDNPLSSEMYVAAPIKVGEQILGVLTLIKPNLSLQPFLENAQGKLKRQGLWLIVAALVLGLALSFWLSRSINKLSDYALKVSQGKSVVTLPEMNDLELHNLAQAMASMKSQLEGKDYVEKYIHSLTHEMKSPVAAIKGAAELLEDNLPVADRLYFVTNIQRESQRLEELISQLLNLAELENRQVLSQLTHINLKALIEELVSGLELKLSEKRLQVSVVGNGKADGEVFLIQQAIENLLLNAIDFSPDGAKITVTLKQHGNRVLIQVEDQGPGVPEYAESRVFERFYSLQRPLSGKKSSGLGLSFVKQICNLHQATCRLSNGSTGALAEINLPVWQKSHTNHTEHT